jgi:hypothetical protein
MPKVPKIKVFCLFYISKIDQTEGCTLTLDHFSSLHTFIRHISGGLDHFDLLITLMKGEKDDE